MWLEKYYLHSIKFLCDVDVTESEEPENYNTLKCFEEDFFDFDFEDSLSFDAFFSFLSIGREPTT